MSTSNPDKSSRFYVPRILHPEGKKVPKTRQQTQKFIPNQPNNPLFYPPNLQFPGNLSLLPLPPNGVTGGWGGTPGAHILYPPFPPPQNVPVTFPLPHLISPPIPSVGEYIAVSPPRTESEDAYTEVKVLETRKLRKEICKSDESYLSSLNNEGRSRVRTIKKKRGVPVVAHLATTSSSSSHHEETGERYSRRSAVSSDEESEINGSSSSSEGEEEENNSCALSSQRPASAKSTVTSSSSSSSPGTTTVTAFFVSDSGLGSEQSCTSRSKPENHTICCPTCHGRAIYHLIPGIPGERGPLGPTGGNGCPGPAGKSGRDGRDGLPGKEGPPGRDGRDGFDGASIQGCEGPRGFPGRDGHTGATGGAAVANGVTNIDLLDNGGLFNLFSQRIMNMLGVTSGTNGINGSSSNSSSNSNGNGSSNSADIVMEPAIIPTDVSSINMEENGVTGSNSLTPSRNLLALLRGMTGPPGEKGARGEGVTGPPGRTAHTIEEKIGTVMQSGSKKQQIALNENPTFLTWPHASFFAFPAGEEAFPAHVAGNITLTNKTETNLVYWVSFNAVFTNKGLHKEDDISICLVADYGTGRENRLMECPITLSRERYTTGILNAGVPVLSGESVVLQVYAVLLPGGEEEVIQITVHNPVFAAWPLITNPTIKLR